VAPRNKLVKACVGREPWTGGAYHGVAWPNLLDARMRCASRARAPQVRDDPGRWTQHGG
jgi:hypothetical protein